MSVKTDFQRLLERRLDKCHEILVVKAKEYARGTNRWHNFDTTARARGKHPVEVADDLSMKHLVSIWDMVGDVKAGKVIDQKVMDEKFTDAINYLLLMEGLIARANKENTEK